ncbi:spermidine synthase SpeE [Thermoclostridium stercorarium subsp. stercorarium DSM 8532]|jgi:spermidine synthase|uniref:Polyamine aminopropyltransferase n=3 Tax=Thermoclostridium stercorarium TaxID=1510 RepID=L7VQ12_THES1|nr:polyamine aminopropyltransferase [Thermoclostridium stercorarium]AGC68779.1 spermidine synthase SpeE [Thermoclostridium stercorarium subsp. stercorarium DSM 8532]AGI39784.1 spermidine synthase [Thermoclostridium stercorarium subsp. stercorarium DSM 8532]ANW99098.1 spermidine synthase [Thermoclostridium stercorarium subsp. thermolacticum DSM 2910]ANX01634.1 spermidine synthase [Thermoclostridium stercorarium subsp. leptospartum DSM 9219]UZQ84747.1 polyamine aminopropyltransferase [Thermoclos
MDLWFTEYHSNYARFSIKVDKPVISLESEFQRIDVFDSYEFGRVLVLDGCLMLTEKDEFIYHEMITHIPMAVNPEIQDVLVIGAGDGGVVRELTKYDSVKRIDMVEIDKLVVDICREYLPQTSCRLDDSRVNIYFEDGLKFVRRKNNEYDLIIVDSTDPFGPGEDLFTREFYGNCYKALKQWGIMVNQHESPYYPNDALSMQRAHKRIKSIFPVAEVYQAHIPTYPSGHWLFGFASKGFHPVADLKENWNSLGLKTRYYNTELHRGCFALPNYVKELLENA